MRGLFLSLLLVFALCTPMLTSSPELGEGTNPHFTSGTAISGASLSSSSGSMNGSENLTITGSGFLDLATNSISHNGQSYSWSTSTVDYVQGSHGSNAVGVTSDGNVHIVYYNIDTNQLRHAEYNGQSWTRSTITTTPNSGVSFSDIQMVVDDNDHIHIAYFHSWKYVVYQVYDGTTWNSSTAASEVNYYGVGLALNSTGSPHIVYTDDGYVCAGLKLATKTESGTWSSTTLDGSSSYVGCYPSIVIDSNDAVYVTYRDHSNGRHNLITDEAGQWDKYQLSNTDNPGYYTAMDLDSNEDLFITHRNSNGLRYAEGAPGSSWSHGEINSNNVEETSVMLDALDTPHVIYWQSSTDDLMYSSRSNSGTWSTTTVDGIAGDDVGRRNSLTIDDDHQIHVAYADVDNKNLKYATMASGLVNTHSLHVQFGTLGNVTATVVDDNTITLSTPAASSAGDVSLGLWDNTGTYRPLNLNYTYVSNDVDDDGILNHLDDCPNTAGNSTADQVGCPDADGDGYSDAGDAFPSDSTEWVDSDGDGVGDNADAFPNDASETLDSDGDGVGDNADSTPNGEQEVQDADGDGVPDATDAFPNDASETTDTDGDGVGDNADAFPNDASETTDTDGDGVGDNADSTPNGEQEVQDSDGDGVPDATDAFPNIATQWADSDGDGYGDNWGSAQWNEEREAYGIGQYIEGAIRSDYCPETSGTSTSDGYFGCVDDNGNGIADLFDNDDSNGSTTVDGPGDAVPAVGLLGSLAAVLVALVYRRR